MEFVPTRSSYQRGQRAALQSAALNSVLALVKVVTGILGHSYALIADGIESILDIISNAVIWGGMRIAAEPADEDHPYGHGKAEPLAGLAVAIFLLGGAAFIAFESIREIITPHRAPAPFTLIVLVGVVFCKEVLFRRLSHLGQELTSASVTADAWHQRSDAITSGAAFCGISIALVMGEGYEAADDWAALLACGVIVFNGIRVARTAISEVMDGAVPEDYRLRVEQMAMGTQHVRGVGRCLVRKSGLGYFVELDVTVEGEMTVRNGHDVATDLEFRLTEARELAIERVTVHVEPE